MLESSVHSDVGLTELMSLCEGDAGWEGPVERNKNGKKTVHAFGSGRFEHLTWTNSNPHRKDDRHWRARGTYERATS